ncbi:ABC transporter permease [Rhizobium sp. CC-YZS058]|uniref:ABC transporter permease n=1 Tax=Rhizobium sp. CC-YZS058 TaxID=3042153 RepID=UPI002B05D295|nr:ABC transporter permease [Rhizobium sp. CC-YZS058]MEA3535873.1 ABC transporter permease [Rhizobium sp. CC-YZS058]
MTTELAEHTKAARLWSRPRLPVGRLGLLTGAVVIGLIFLVAVSAPWIAPHSPYEQSLTDRLIPPVFMENGSWNHVLGTDHLGRDYLSRLIYGARLSLLVGFGTILISAIVGIGLGLLGGYFGGRTDMAVMFILTVRLSLPIMLAAISLVGLLGNSLPLMMLILACFLWDQFLVVTRSLTMRLRDAEFVLAAKSAGLSDLRIMTSEILPNLVSPLVVVATLEMAHAILLEAALSFLGLGIRPPDTSWGLMIAEAKDFVFFESWLVNIPGLAIFVLVVGITLLGEGLRVLLAPDSSQS